MTQFSQRSMVDAICLSPDDNVATVLRSVAFGEVLRVRCGNDVSKVLAREAIALCHKISLSRLAAGTPVVKYGNSIGNTLAVIEAGHHVHVHNMRSARAQVGIAR